MENPKEPTKLIRIIANIQQQLKSIVKREYLNINKEILFEAEADSPDSAQFIADYWITNCKKTAHQNGLKVSIQTKEFKIKKTQAGFLLMTLKVAIILLP